MFKYYLIISVFVAYAAATSDIRALQARGAQKIKMTTEVETAFCTLYGGRYVPAGQKETDRCTDTPQTDEECITKGGKLGVFCLEESRCVDAYNFRCYFPVPEDLITPAVKLNFDNEFQMHKEAAQIYAKLNYKKSLKDAHRYPNLFPLKIRFPEERKPGLKASVKPGLKASVKPGLAASVKPVQTASVKP